MEKEINSLDQYQKETLETWGGSNALIRSFLGIAGESGEVCEISKKYLRGDYTHEEMIVKLTYELGDLLYYIAVCAAEHGLYLGDIATKNILKLRSRSARGKICGEGDDR